MAQASYFLLVASSCLKASFQSSRSSPQLFGSAMAVELTASMSALSLAKHVCFEVGRGGLPAISSACLSAFAMASARERGVGPASADRAALSRVVPLPTGPCCCRCRPLRLSASVLGYVRSRGAPFAGGPRCRRSRCVVSPPPLNRESQYT